jgi:hypothetical protein
MAEVKEWKDKFLLGAGNTLPSKSKDEEAL